MTPVIEVKMMGVEYVGYFFGTEITRNRTMSVVLEKLIDYVKGRS